MQKGTMRQCKKEIHRARLSQKHKYVPSLLECTNHRKVQKLNKPDNTPRVAVGIYNTTYKNIMVHVRRSKLQIPCSSEIKLPHASESSIKYRLHSASGEPGPHVIFPTIFFFFYRAWSSRPEALCLLVDSSRPRSESSRTCHSEPGPYVLVLLWSRRVSFTSSHWRHYPTTQCFSLIESARVNLGLPHASFPLCRSIWSHPSLGK